jgi:hypothetical protein
LPATLKVDNMPVVRGVCSISDSSGTIFVLACERFVERNAVFPLAD